VFIVDSLRSLPSCPAYGCEASTNTVNTVSDPNSAECEICLAGRPNDRVGLPRRDTGEQSRPNHKLENKIYPRGGGSCKASGQTVILKILDLIDNGTYAVSALLLELHISEASLSSISAS
jgi:hypothetical protein